MEEYKWGDWASGRRHTHSFDVNVRSRTTTTTVPTSNSTEDKEFEVTTSNYPENTFIHGEEIDSEEIMKYDDEYEEYIEHNGSTGFQEYYEEIENNKINARSDIPIYYDEDVEALATEDEASVVVIFNLRDIFS